MKKLLCIAALLACGTALFALEKGNMVVNLMIYCGQRHGNKNSSVKRRSISSVQYRRKSAGLDRCVFVSNGEKRLPGAEVYKDLETKLKSALSTYRERPKAGLIDGFPLVCALHFGRFMLPYIWGIGITILCFSFRMRMEKYLPKYYSVMKYLS
jgi:hypothetical protein